MVGTNSGTVKADRPKGSGNRIIMSNAGMGMAKAKSIEPNAERRNKGKSKK